MSSMALRQAGAATGKRGLAGLVPPLLCLLLAGAAAALIFATPTPDFAAFLGLDAALLLVLIMGVWIDGRRRGRLDPATPPAVLTTTSLLFFGVAGLPLFRDASGLDPRVGSYYWVNVAMGIAVAGNLALWLGYLWSARGFRPAARPQRSPLRLDVIVLLFAASIFAHLYAIQSGRFAFLGGSGTATGLSQPLFYGMELGTYSLLLAGWHVFRGGASNLLRYLFYVMFASQIGFAVLSGMKQQIVEVLAAVALSYLYARGRVPFRLAILALVLLVLVYPANLTYRSMVRSGALNTTSLFDAVGAMATAVNEVWLQQSATSSLGTTLQQAQGRQAGLLQDIGLIARYTPNPYPYRHGYDYIALPARILIPRLIWSDKPVGQLGYIMSRYYEGLPEPYAHLTSTATTQFGDLYLNFGFPGVLAGMLLIGYLAGRLYGFLQPNLSDSRLLLYFVVFINMANVEPDITGMMQSIFQGMVVAAAVAWLAHLQRGQRARLSLPMLRPGRAW